MWAICQQPLPLIIPTELALIESSFDNYQHCWHCTVFVQTWNLVKHLCNTIILPINNFKLNWLPGFCLPTSAIISWVEIGWCSCWILYTVPLFSNSAVMASACLSLQSHFVFCDLLPPLPPQISPFPLLHCDAINWKGCQNFDEIKASIWL